MNYPRIYFPNNSRQGIETLRFPSIEESLLRLKSAINCSALDWNCGAANDLGDELFIDVSAVRRADVLCLT